MITSSFNSQRNVNALKSIIQESVQKELRLSSFPISNYQDSIQETMKYVEKNVSPDVPYGISKDEYLMMMNKKVYNIITPIIRDEYRKSSSQGIKKSSQQQQQQQPPLRTLPTEYTMTTSFIDIYKKE